MISSVLFDSLSSAPISLTTRVGESAYFEHEFLNNSNKSTLLLIQWEDPDLRYSRLIVIHVHHNYGHVRVSKFRNKHV